MAASRISVEVLKAVDAYAHARGITRSKAIARLVELGLKAERR